MLGSWTVVCERGVISQCLSSEYNSNTYVLYTGMYIHIHIHCCALQEGFGYKADG